MTTVAQVIEALEAMDSPETKVLLCDDYGGMRDVGEIRKDDWPVDDPDGERTPHVIFFTPGTSR